MRSDLRILDRRRRAAAGRIAEIDAVRGICVLLMVFDHALLWLGEAANVLYGTAGWTQVSRFCAWYERWDVREQFRMLVVSVFFGISGVSASLSRSNILRGLRLCIPALTVTLVSFAYDLVSGQRIPTYTIGFGVLHCLAASMLTEALFAQLFSLGRNTRFAKAFFYVALGTVMAAIGFVLLKSEGQAPDDTLFFLGFISRTYAAGDWEPMLPWTGMYLIGAALGSLLYERRRSLFRRPYNVRFVLFLGRHALAAYFVHLGAIFAVMATLVAAFGGTLL